MTDVLAQRHVGHGRRAGWLVDNQTSTTCGKSALRKTLAVKPSADLADQGAHGLTGIDPVPVSPPAVGVRAEVRAKKTATSARAGIPMVEALLHFTRVDTEVCQ